MILINAKRGGASWETQIRIYVRTPLLLTASRGRRSPEVGPAGQESQVRLWLDWYKAINSCLTVP